MNKNKEILMLILIVFTVLIMYRKRPFFIDDYFHYTVAKQIVKNPLRPYDFEGNEISGKMIGWQKGKIPWLLNPPLMHYFLALSIKIFGQEIIYHRISFIFFALISVLCMYFISRKYTDYPFYAALLMFSTPTFLVTNIGLMIDSVLLSFFLLSFFLFDVGFEKKNKFLLVLSGILSGLTVLVKYTGFSIILVVLSYLILKRKEIKQYGFFVFWFFIPITIFILWTIWNILSYGSSHFFSCLKDSLISSGNVFYKIINQASFFSGSLIFPIFIFFVFLAKKRRFIIYSFFILLFVLFSVFSSTIGGYSVLQSILLSSFIISAFYFLLSFFLLNDKTDFRNIFFASWLIITILVITRSIMWSATRYFMIVLPAAVILFINVSRNVIENNRIFNYYRYLVLIITLFLGLIVTYADYQQASIYKKIADDLKEENLFNLGFKNKYFISNSFIGLSYYLEKHGWQYFYKDTELQVGDLLFFGFDSVPITIGLFDKLKSNFKYINLVRTFEYKTKIPVFVMSKNSSAGLYASLMGSLPFSFAEKPFETYYLYQKIK